MVGAEKIVGNIEIDPAVRIVVPPGGRKPLPVADQPSAFRRFDKLAGAWFGSLVIAVEPVPLARFILFERPVRFEQGSNLIPVGLWRDHFATRKQLEIDLLRPRLADETVGDQVRIEVAIAIVVGEAHHDTRSREAETEFIRPLFEFARASVDEQAVGRAVAADIEVEQTIALDIDECRADRPVSRELGRDSRCLGNVFELEPSQISIQL